MHRILVATDLSVASRAAYSHAVAFARIYTEATVTLLYVEESPDAESSVLLEVAAQQAEARSKHESELADVAAALQRLGVNPEVERVTGSAHRAILERADGDADLVIIAKHGVRESDPGHMGSTAERVMHHAAVPVLIAYDPAPPPLPAGKVVEYKRFVVSTDYSEDSRFGIREIAKLAERCDGQVEVLHAITLPPEVQAHRRETYMQAQLDHLNQRLAEEVGHPRVTGRIHAGLRVPETVIEGATAAGADLLCVPTHGKGALRRALFGSIADRVMKMAPMPAMILPRRWLRD